MNKVQTEDMESSSPTAMPSKTAWKEREEPKEAGGRLNNDQDGAEATNRFHIEFTTFTTN